MQSTGTFTTDSTGAFVLVINTNGCNQTRNCEIWRILLTAQSYPEHSSHQDTFLMGYKRLASCVMEKIRCKVEMHLFRNSSKPLSSQALRADYVVLHHIFPRGHVCLLFMSSILFNIYFCTLKVIDLNWVITKPRNNSSLLYCNVTDL